MVDVENYRVERMNGMGVEATIALSNHPSKAQLKLIKNIFSGDGGFFVGVIYRESGGADIEVDYQDKYPITIKGSSEERTNACRTLEKILKTRLISERH